MKSKLLTTLSVAALVAAGATAVSAEPLKVGVLATLEGTYTVLGEDGRSRAQDRSCPGQ